MNNLILGRHVREALLNGNPIVALESTVITHGLPEPENLNLALNLEKIIATYSAKACQLNSSPRDDYDELGIGSVVPATVGIIKGKLVVGLSGDEIQYLAEKNKSRPIKASRHDLPIAQALKLSAGTTVSGTMAIVNGLNSLNGVRPLIKVFATGGTGGVHLGGESSMDVSADLYEFARSPIGVVSSGFKSFLDTRRSLELLETLGCPVVKLAFPDSDDKSSSSSMTMRNRIHMGGSDGKKKESSHLFPAFFLRHHPENIKISHAVFDLDEAAAVLYECLEASELALDSRRAVLLANPIPEEFSLKLEAGGKDIIADIGREIDQRQDLEGKEKTPLILERLNIESGGKTLRANVELLKNNALVGAKLALKYHQNYQQSNG